jgi:hypothetical protein
MHPQNEQRRPGQGRRSDDTNGINHSNGAREIVCPREFGKSLPASAISYLNRNGEYEIPPPPATH